MEELLDRFEHKKPEIVFEWNDRETEARGWLIINSLRGGAAGGGTRMRKNLTLDEVVFLAKTMEVKFTVSGPAIGGAKSGINFDPADARKEQVLERWYSAITPLLKSSYGTGGDLNVDLTREVIPITGRCGLHHPQEGIVNGHFPAAGGCERIARLNRGIRAALDDADLTPEPGTSYTLGDMITGYGIVEAVYHYYNIWEEDAAPKSVLIQGCGSVGTSAAYYFVKKGFRVVGILDERGGRINEAGFAPAEIKELFHPRKRAAFFRKAMPFAQADDRMWDLSADVLVPAAGSNQLRKSHLERLQAGKLGVIACGANLPFDDGCTLFGSTARYADTRFAVIPDFIANCGMARAYAYLMGTSADASGKAIYGDVSSTIKNALQAVHQASPSGRGLLKHSLEIALNKIG